MNENERITPEGHSRVEYLLEQLIEKVEESSGGGTTFKYGGRVDTKADLDLITGAPNQIYFVGLVDSQNFDEYVWAEPTGAASGHWDLLGTTTIVADSALDKTSHNPIQNAPVATAVENLQNTKANTSDLATVATSGSYNDLTNKPDPVDITVKANSTALAPAYDASHTYVDGELMTKDGDLYVADSANGSYLRITNLLDPSVAPTIANYLVEWQFGQLDQTDPTSGQSDVYDIGVTVGTTYIVAGDLSGITPRGGGEPCSCTARNTTHYNNSYGSYIPMTTAGTTITADRPYIYLTVNRAKKDTCGVWTVSAQKFRKVDMDSVKMDLESNYITLGNGTRVYFTDTAPTGTIPEGSYGFGF